MTFRGLTIAPKITANDILIARKKLRNTPTVDAELIKQRKQIENEWNGIIRNQLAEKLINSIETNLQHILNNIETDNSTMITAWARFNMPTAQKAYEVASANLHNNVWIKRKIEDIARTYELEVTQVTSENSGGLEGDRPVYFLDFKVELTF